MDIRPRNGKQKGQKKNHETNRNEGEGDKGNDRTCMECLFRPFRRENETLTVRIFRWAIESVRRRDVMMGSKNRFARDRNR